jgi:hypothetical protein
LHFKATTRWEYFRYRKNGNRKHWKPTANSSAIVANTIGRIGDMPIIASRVISLNKQAGELKHKPEINDGTTPNKNY